jgi:rod shape determining protein RodA
MSLFDLHAEDRSAPQSLLGRIARALNLDVPLTLGLLALCAIGLMVVHSAGGADLDLTLRQAARMGIAFTAMVALANVPPHILRLWAPFLFALGVALLLVVDLVGVVGKGAQRWLDLGFIRFQPSEMMKIVVPMMVAWYLHEKPLPPTFGQVLAAFGIVGVPVVLTAIQPDLGTALLIAAAGVFAVYCSGILWRYILGAAALAAAVAPFLWARLHDYQKLRVLNFLDPERDPLGSGYHIIQSKIAVGSGGVFGRGWLEGTQSQLDFLPERHTDFIFAVAGEEFGLVGALLLLAIYGFIIFRSLAMAASAERTFGRLLGGALALTFVVYVFVNIGMVCGLLPVVGVPLPLVSYGGTSMVTLMAGFGILMSIHSHRKLMSL